MVTRRELLQASATIPLATMATAFAGDAKASLAAAPFAGHCTHLSVRIWLQSSGDAKAVIEYWPQDGGDRDARKTSPVALREKDMYAAIVDIADLRAATRYAYRIVLDSHRASGTCQFRTSPAPGAIPADFRLYFGSCAYTETMSPSGNPYGDEFHIFDRMAEQMQADKLPHFMLWLGDNLYLRPKGKFLGVADFDNAARMAGRYREVRGMKMLQKLFAATHHYAIWDDHDYGSNDADKSFAYKDDALRLFGQYWPNPHMGSTELPGTWCKFTHEDAEFHLLDDRFHRDAEKAAASPEKAMFGPAQMAWLKKSLRDSNATFKVIANGSQLLSEHDNGSHSGWHSYQAERDEFLVWLAREKIAGLVFLSGDRHNTQVFRLALVGAPVIYEFSCSPLTSRLYKLDKRERANPRLVKELVVEARNFGTLEFAGQGLSRKLIARCFDSNAKLLWEKTVAGAKMSATGEPA